MLKLASVSSIVLARARMSTWLTSTTLPTSKRFSGGTLPDLTAARWRSRLGGPRPRRSRSLEPGPAGPLVLTNWEIPPGSGPRGRAGRFTRNDCRRRSSCAEMALPAPIRPNWPSRQPFMASHRAARESVTSLAARSPRVRAATNRIAAAVGPRASLKPAPSPKPIRPPPCPACARARLPGPPIKTTWNRPIRARWAAPAPQIRLLETNGSGRSARTRPSAPSTIGQAGSSGAVSPTACTI